MKKLMYYILSIAIAIAVLVPVGVYAEGDIATPVTWSTTDITGSPRLSNNNLTASFQKYYQCVRTDKSVNSGKYYWEITFHGTDKKNSRGTHFGVAEKDAAIGQLLTTGKYRTFYGYTGNKFPGDISYAKSIENGDVLGILLDMDSKKISFRINNIDYGVAFDNLPDTNVAPIMLHVASFDSSSTANFGATPFTYSIPDGYLPYDISNYLGTPTNLTTTASGTGVDLKWDAVTNATGYNVKRSTTSGGPYETVAGAVYGSTYTDSLLTPGTTYYYVVSAVNSGMESANSNEATVTIPNKPVLNVTAVNDKFKVNDEFTVDVVLSNVTKICAEDIRINYNTELFEYLGSEPTPGLKVYKEAQPITGTLRYIVASLGKDNAVTGEKALIKLKFRAKKAGQDKIDIIRGRIADNGTMEIDVEEVNCGDKLITVEGIKDVNRSGEFTLIDLAVDAWYYGDPVANTDTTKYDTDLSGDGIVDEVDLLTIVDEMLKNSNYTANN